MSKKDKITKSPNRLILVGFFLVLALIIIAFSYLLFLLYYQDRFFPGIKIAGISVSGQKPSVIREYLQSTFTTRVKQPVTFNYKEQTFTINLEKASPNLNTDEAVESGFKIGRSGKPLQDLQDQLQTLIHGATFESKLNFGNSSFLISQIKQINEVIKYPATNALINLSDTVKVVPAQNGQELNDQQLLNQLTSFLTLKSSKPTTLPVQITLPAFPTQTALKYQKLLEASTKDPIRLHFQKQTITLDSPTLLSILNLNENKPVLASGTIIGQNFIIEQIAFEQNSFSDSQPLIDINKLTNFLQNLSDSIDQPTQDAKFAVDPSAPTGQIKVMEFQPAKEGRKLDIDQTAELLTKALDEKIAKDITLPITITKPKVTTESVNNLGIKELIGEGVSHFAGSISNRIYNIGLAASRIHGTLVAPGDVFSFNKAVGDINGTTGYKPAYVIKSGRTVLDDGGGVCQVSTTVFRAAINSGLPIVERTAHAYRVGYYEQDSGPGLDATVFSPSVDLKFKNDTGNYILVQSSAVGTDLYIEIYGTSDGRQTVVNNSVVLSQTPPLPDVRQDDPTLQKGEVKQVDWSAWGANVYFTRTVTKNGEEPIKETWRSVYRPWQAIFLVGTKE